MLLNLSNHPSNIWPENQIQLANSLYHVVTDLPFPQINPESNSDDLEQLVEEYEIKIRQTNPTTVHIMGELTFTYRLVNKLKAIGINCIASTTERKVTIEDNLKTSQFQFVQFRPY
jgi:hypothetical protein